LQDINHTWSFMDNLSYLNNADPAIIDSLYESYKKDPESVDFGWRKFFEGFEFSHINYNKSSEDDSVSSAEFKVINLIEDYRKRGHLFTKTNPVRVRRTYVPTLAIENFGLSSNDLNKEFEAGNKLGIGRARLSEILDALEQTYCQSIGAEYAYIRNAEIVAWLKSKMESTRNNPQFDQEEKLNILQNLTEAVGFEKFVHKKFPGQKRFS